MVGWNAGSRILSNSVKLTNLMSWFIMFLNMIYDNIYTMIEAIMVKITRLKRTLEVLGTMPLDSNIPEAFERGNRY
jgi:hypothetical protein